LTPTASIVVPTRRRREYLAVALKSVAPQVVRHGAEVIVVEDDLPDATTERLTAEVGARYIALGSARGINVARNAGVDAAGASLVCFLDDDVEVWPGWLSALLAAAAADPACAAFGGPIRPRLEGRAPRMCGREGPTVTALDLGSADRDAEFVWGANFALRRAAYEQVGPFDPTLNFAGDEEEWQMRLRASGGRIRYVAAAGVDHRRAGDDARLRSLTRAAWRRGHAARRWDARKGTAPPAQRELRTLAGCVWHIGRYRCANGVPLAAMSAGRLQEALSPTPLAANPSDPDYLSGQSGTLSRRTAALGALHDLAADIRLAPLRARIVEMMRRAPRRRVLVLGVERNENRTTVGRAARELFRSRHEVEIRFVSPAAGGGKWANLNSALREHPVAGFDWLVLVDDDVLLRRGFLDRFLAVAEHHDLVLAQPAHAFRSHAAWPVTRRVPGVLARRTRFVEQGPVTAIRADAFPELLPFPDLQMGWGIDSYWAAVAENRGWPVGVVDATPVRHLRPVASNYPRDAALAEAAAFLRDRPYVGRPRANETLATWR
jgi:GT2 family glycosyltransferase